ncbi:MAG: hypothetical protein A2381_14035 [Bdellovibrionales bacterium RIFOXYB1_FULL_37_110]|nr:MAG: hypothetical protein A2381_14035 [Bdellovibrionales bacterium RIFOXYB1_FULL_37_110]
MRLYFIGGASGSGKTAVMPYLKELLGDGIAVYDFDDIGVPDGADKKWRQESTEKWLQKLLSDGKDACLLGFVCITKIHNGLRMLSKNMLPVLWILPDYLLLEAMKRLRM